MTRRSLHFILFFFLQILMFGQEVELTHVGTFDTGIFDEGAAEIVAFDEKSQRVFFTNANDMTIGILDITDPSNPALVSYVDMSSYGSDVNSVSAYEGLIAVAVAADPKTRFGSVVFMDYEGNFIDQVKAGALPDMLAFTPDGKKVLVANEGEPNDEYTYDPQGSVSIIDVATMKGKNVYIGGYRVSSVRYFGPNARRTANDLEPEYLTISSDSKYAYVSCQENNAFLTIDIENAKLLTVKGLGYKDYSKPENAIDASDRSETVDIRTWPVLGMYQPDAISSYEVNGKTYIVSANEGDARDYDGYSEEVRVKDLTLDPVKFPNAEELQKDENLGRLKTTTANGDTDGDGDHDIIYSYGARSFSIWNEYGSLVYDSGNEFVTRLVELEGDNYVKNRSDDKGSEPEAVEIVEFGDEIYAFIGLERQNGIFVYNISNPRKPYYVNYFPTEGIGPEDIKYISADLSPNGENIIVVSNEVSGTITIFQMEQGSEEVGEEEEEEGLMFDEEVVIDDYSPTTAVMPPSPLSTQVVFVGGYDIVQTTATYGNPAGRAIAKEWHDFIGFTPDDSEESLGWVSVNHEMIYKDDKIGDGGGMTTFKIGKDADGSIEVIEQTLADGRQGQFFNVDFANTVGETGMNCAGISAPDGRIWTAEEWYRSNNASIGNGFNPVTFAGDLGVRDLEPFTIDAPEFPVVDGMTIEKYQNFNYMVEIDPKEAVALRKQYNWGRAGWEGGAITEAGDYVYLGIDATPAPWARFVPDTPHDFTSGKMQVYKHDAPRGEKWIDVPETVETTVGGGLNSFAWSVGATMYNRNEWVTIDHTTGMVYWTETGRDNPGGRWADEISDGAVYAPHHSARASEQGVADPGDGEYWDYFGRVLYYNPSTEEVGVTIEGGPYFEASPSEAEYPSKHLSNPDGLNVLNVGGKSYLMIQEDLNGTSFGRTPDGVSNRLCELYLLDASISDATIDDLIRITAVPAGAEITGAIQIDDNTILVNSQHPRADNPFPYNHSLTMAIHGFEQLTNGILEGSEMKTATKKIKLNSISREIELPEPTDLAVYNAKGKRLKVFRNTRSADMSQFSQGDYYIKTNDDSLIKLIIE